MAQHVVVDRLIEAVAAGTDGGDDGAEDAGLPPGHERPRSRTSHRLVASQTTSGVDVRG